MKTVVIRTIEDFEKIDEETSEIEFVKYDGPFHFTDDCILPSITFTKMYVFIDILPLSLEKIYLYDCDADFADLKRFSSLKYLKITNRLIDIKDISDIVDLEELSLNLCTIKNVEILGDFKKLKKLSLRDTNIQECNFLLRMDSLESVVIDDKIYAANKECFDMLSQKGVIVGDGFGGDDYD